MNSQFVEIKEAVHILCEPGRVHELRALGVPTGNGWTSTFSGYFDDVEALAGAAANLDRKGAKGVYVTPNPVQPDLLARRKNVAKRCRKRDPLTKNGEISRRRWLLLDLDPKRPAGISSTAAELEAARARAVEVAHFLKGKGFPGGVLAESGNGAHLLYRVDLPAEDSGLVKRVLEGVAERFPVAPGGAGVPVEVDTGVHNAARIWKLYGTTARKGDATESRPHRRAKVLRVADPLEVVPRATLEAIAEPPTAKRKATGRAHATDSQAKPSGQADSLSEEEVRKALACIPSRPDYDEWLRIVAAVHGAVGGDVATAERLLIEWSAEEETGEYRRKLESGFDGSITVGTLVHAAKRHGYTPPSKRNGRARRSGKAKPYTGKAVPVAGVLASDVERRPIRWIWKGRLARGEMTILDGDPGLGKSTLLCDLAARITTGRPMPEEEVPFRDGPGGVVLVTTEDSPSHTIRPRLDAAGADPSKVRIVATVPTRDDEGGWDAGEQVPKLPEDLPVLKATCKDVGADLLVIDPLLAHLSSEVNTFKDGDVRSALAPVQAFAEEAGLAVVVVRHLTKGSAGNNPLYRGQASIGIIGAARLAFAFGEDPENAGHLALAPNKINLGKRPPALELCLQDSPDVGEVARVRWLGTSNLTAQDLFGGSSSERRDEATKEAEAFLKEVLAGGPRRSTEVHDFREERGISKRTFYRAKDNLGVVSEQEPPVKGPHYMVPPWSTGGDDGKSENADDTDCQAEPDPESWQSDQNAQNGDLGGETDGNRPRTANSGKLATRRRGDRVCTPDGEGEVLEVLDTGRVAVRHDGGVFGETDRVFNSEQIEGID